MARRNGNYKAESCLKRHCHSKKEGIYNEKISMYDFGVGIGMYALRL